MQDRDALVAQLEQRLSALGSPTGAAEIVAQQKAREALRLAAASARAAPYIEAAERKRERRRRRNLRVAGA
jgi:hypothetical protein